MKYIIGAFLSIVLFNRCTSSSVPSTKDTTAVVPQSVPVQGIYKGDFAGNPIYITINYASGTHVAGYNTCKGLRRNLSGSIKQTTDGWELDLNEPGDHPFDGKFKLAFDVNFASAKGQWNPLNTPSSLKEKQFTLTRTEINPNHDEAYLYPMDADHADIVFQEDGNCIFNYYDKINDSTFAEQMNTVRGTWEKKDSSLLVTWHKTAQWDRDKSVFTITVDGRDNGGIATVTGEGHEFNTAF